MTDAQYAEFMAYADGLGRRCFSGRLFTGKSRGTYAACARNRPIVDCMASKRDTRGRSVLRSTYLKATSDDGGR